MAKLEAIKCDRCGFVDTMRPDFGHMSIGIGEGGIKATQVDLCPNCISRLNEWLSEGGVKGGVNECQDPTPADRCSPEL